MVGSLVIDDARTGLACSSDPESDGSVIAPTHAERGRTIQGYVKVGQRLYRVAEGYNVVGGNIEVHAEMEKRVKGTGLIESKGKKEKAMHEWPLAQ